jgi:hypothetical protein
MRRCRLFLVLVVAAATAACHRRPSDPLAAFALSVVDSARSPAGLDAHLVDDELVEAARRLQLVRRTTLDTGDPAQLVAVFHGDAGPDRNYPPAERPRMQRERATRGLRATLEGRCTAVRSETMAAARVHFLVEPLPRLPPEIVEGQQALARQLEGAEVARLTCKRGDVGMLVVRRGGERKLVDIFPTMRPLVEISPNEPTMK